jgi:predicted kinase
MSKCVIIVGPPGAGKTTMARQMVDATDIVYVNQDSQKADHMDIFIEAVYAGKKVVVDRMNFNKQQRAKYLDIAKLKGYETQIIVLHQPYQVCLERVRARFGQHETINEEKAARGALQTFFGKYERPAADEADEIQFEYPVGDKPQAIWSDLDGTLCNCEHRRHHVHRADGQKKDWFGFFKAMADDTVNQPVMDVLNKFKDSHQIVYCSGRPDDWMNTTKEWLTQNRAPEGPLFMRIRHDSRPDNIVKEILLDFEVLTRFNLCFCLDYRDQVVKMLRGRGMTAFQVAPGDF